jgi:hypothetical protein
MTPEEAIQELAMIAHAVFPNEPTELTTPRANMSNLQRAIEDMLERRGFSTTIKLNDKKLATAKCKVYELMTIHPLRQRMANPT